MSQALPVSLGTQVIQVPHGAAGEADVGEGGRESVGGVEGRVAALGEGGVGRLISEHHVCGGVRAPGVQPPTPVLRPAREPDEGGVQVV